MGLSQQSLVNATRQGFFLTRVLHIKLKRTGTPSLLSKQRKKTGPIIFIEVQGHAVELNVAADATLRMAVLRKHF